MRKILIANRGEIARRVIRTAHAMGLETVAVFSDSDAGLPFVREATQAVPIGPAPATESYLVVDKILDAARRTGADAVHPGYGFLSENAAFAEACAAAGIAFIGPPPSAIRAMGLKDAAKRTMKSAGVPVVPGYQGDDQSLDRLERAAKAIGYPILIKAVAGGGGKGMRRVDDPKTFADNLLACKREAQRAFGNDSVLIERYLTKPRHIEVQVFGDSHGNVVHLFERDCSAQRRHQKVLEEAPAPGMPLALRQAMGDAAVKAAQSIGYVGAGTVEFIVDASVPLEQAEFYFMEMNTRLQVEHPVTELVTGLDLVEWQIRVARGEKLPLLQDQLGLKGHAVEARLYAEDADAGFLPSIGVLRALAFPEGRSGIRIDSGVEQGSEITVHYDPMIAKVIAYGPDRATAISRLIDALDATIVSGPTTNRAFLARLLGHARFRKGDVSTGMIEEVFADLKTPSEIPPKIIALAALASVTPKHPFSSDAAAASPWSALGPWRMNLPPQWHVDFTLPGGEHLSLSVLAEDALRRVVGLAEPVTGRGRWKNSLTFEADFDGSVLTGVVLESPSEIEVRVWGQTYRFARGLTAGDRVHATLRDGIIKAPMPGRILALDVKPGQFVEEGQRLLLMEAMKMEHRLVAPAKGTVKTVAISEGAQVGEGAVLLELDVER
jgi:3-methylcrotonyl-CoA carboxylase alpha subunit